ncbi:MAG: hypothetical protein WCG40_03045 [Actinomycetes bacterium]
MTKLFVEKLLRCVTGLALFGIGITFFIRADLGLAPWDIFHTGVAERLDISVGIVIVGTGLLLLLLWIPLRQKPGLGTILNALEIGLMVNVSKQFIGETNNLAARLLLVLAGLVVVGVGTALYLGSDLGSGPRDGIMLGMTKRKFFGRSLSIRLARTLIEVTVLVAGLFLGGKVGIGTLVFMFGIGPLVQFLLPFVSVRNPQQA